MRVLVADDYEQVRRNVRSILQPMCGVEICGEAINGRDAIRQAEELRPDVIVLDITMPEMDGMSAARAIRQSVPETAIVFFTMHDGLVDEARALGASGYVLKEDAATGLVDAIDAVARHRTFFPSYRISKNPAF